MQRATKDAWLASGAGDLAERDVEDVPVKGRSVRVRGLPAAYSNQASSEALVFKTTSKGEQIATVDQAKLEALQFAHGVIDPQFSVVEAEQIAQKFGPAFKRVVTAIDELSGVDKEAIVAAEARFPAGESVAAGDNGLSDAASAGDGGSTVPARAGA